MTWHSGNEYSGRDMARMQAEAAERVREMQERARRVVDMDTTAYSGHFSVPVAKPVIQVPQIYNGSGGHSGNGSSFSSGGGNGASKLSHGASGHGNSGSSFGGGNGGLLSGFSGLITGGPESPISKALDALGIDNDKIIIIVLLLVLINNNADKKLILALCYVLI